MTPRLLKLSIPKCSLARRIPVHEWLHAMMDGHDQLMPAARCPADALRVATSYVLKDWSQWKGEDGTVYRAIAASPTEQKGLVLDINVQVRRPDTVKYSELLCRLSCDENGRPGFTHGEAHGLQFYDLVQALNVERLLTLGQDHLFEQDLRRLAEDLLETDVQRLWPGTWLALGDTPGLAHLTHLATLLTTGALTVRTLSLESSQANREMLAQELAQEYVRQLDGLGKRLAYPKPQVTAIEKEYMKLTEKIRQSEELLGVQVPCLTEQIAFESALAATDC